MEKPCASAQESQIKSKAVMSGSLRNKKRHFFLFCPKGIP